LQVLHGVDVSCGAIVEVLHRLSAHAHPVLADLKAAIRASPALQPGRQEDGLKGSLWSVNTPTVRSDKSHHSRVGDVVTPVMGDPFQDMLGSDVSAGDMLSQGLHQRWWVHDLRDMQTRTDKGPIDEEVCRWANAVTDMDDHAVAWVAQKPNSGWSPR
jgi:hypothetical protein